MNLLTLQPELIKQAIEEVLRYDGPVHRTTIRTTAEDVEIGGVNIPRAVSFSLHRGMQSRCVEIFQILTASILLGSLAESGFGYGAHFCLGLHLARLEAQTLLVAR